MSVIASVCSWGTNALLYDEESIDLSSLTLNFDLIITQIGANISKMSIILSNIIPSAEEAKIGIEDKIELNPACEIIAGSNPNLRYIKPKINEGIIISTNLE